MTCFELIFVKGVRFVSIFIYFFALFAAVLALFVGKVAEHFMMSGGKTNQF